MENNKEFLSFIEMITHPFEQNEELIFELEIIDACNIVLLFGIQGKKDEFDKFCKMLQKEHGELKFILMLAKMHHLHKRLMDCKDKTEYLLIVNEIEELKESCKESKFEDELISLLKERGINKA